MGTAGIQARAVASAGAGRAAAPSTFANWSVTRLPWPAFFGTALALYAALAVSRLHEVVPFLGRFYAGKVLAALLIAAIAVDASKQEWSRGLQTTVSKCIGAILILAVLSIPGSVWPRQSVLYFQDQWPQSILLFICIMVGFANRRTAYVTIAAVAFTAALGALEMVVGMAGQWDGRGMIASEASITYDANATAALLAGLLPYLVMFATSKGKLRPFAMAAIPITVIAIVKTVSRGGTVALGVCAISLLLLAPKKQRKYYVALLLVMVAAVFIAPHQGLVERFSTLSGDQDYNFNARDGRIEVWKRGIGMMMAHPFLGIGVTAYMYANGAAAHSWVNAHNAFVQIGAELGVGGLVAFTWAVVAAFRAGWGIRKRTAPGPQGFRSPQDEFDFAFATAALCSLATTIAASLFLSMAYDTITLLAMAVPAALTVRSVSASPRVRAAVRGVRQAIRGPVQSGPMQPGPMQPGPGVPGWRSARRIPRPLPAPPANP